MPYNNAEPFLHDAVIIKLVEEGATRSVIQQRTRLSKSGVRKALIRLGLKASYGGNGPKLKD